MHLFTLALIELFRVTIVQIEQVQLSFKHIEVNRTKVAMAKSKETRERFAAFR